MSAELNLERHSTVSFAVALATILVLGIFVAVMVMFLREGLPVERLSISWIGEQEGEQAANIAATPRELSYFPISLRP